MIDITRGCRYGESDRHGRSRRSVDNVGADVSSVPITVANVEANRR